MAKIKISSDQNLIKVDGKETKSYCFKETDIDGNQCSNCDISKSHYILCDEIPCLPRERIDKRNGIFEELP